MELQAKLVNEGWKVRKGQVFGGCYEIYGVDAKGQRAEAFFDPKTFERVMPAGEPAQKCPAAMPRKTCCARCSAAANARPLNAMRTDGEAARGGASRHTSDVQRRQKRTTPGMNARFTYENCFSMQHSRSSIRTARGPWRTESSCGSHPTRAHQQTL